MLDMLPSVLTERVQRRMLCVWSILYFSLVLFVETLIQSMTVLAVVFIEFVNCCLLYVREAIA